jgi:hypothetical protein
MYRAFIAGALTGAIVLAFALNTSGTRSMADDSKSERQLVHNVYFTLKDGSPENIRALSNACHKYLTGHEGEVYFAAGGVVDELQRPVNQRDFHVALCVVFKNKATHDTYQTHPKHLQFISENKDTWAQVRVFDSWNK